jgi:hypothetical protein
VARRVRAWLRIWQRTLAVSLARPIVTGSIFVLLFATVFSAAAADDDSAGPHDAASR